MTFFVRYLLIHCVKEMAKTFSHVVAAQPTGTPWRIRSINSGTNGAYLQDRTNTISNTHLLQIAIACVHQETGRLLRGSDTRWERANGRPAQSTLSLSNSLTFTEPEIFI